MQVNNITIYDMQTFNARSKTDDQQAKIST